MYLGPFVMLKVICQITSMLCSMLLISILCSAIGVISAYIPPFAAVVLSILKYCDMSSIVTSLNLTYNFTAVPASRMSSLQINKMPPIIPAAKSVAIKPAKILVEVCQPYTISYINHAIIIQHAIPHKTMQTHAKLVGLALLFVRIVMFCNISFNVMLFTPCC